jgi:hypothetical protein
VDDVELLVVAELDVVEELEDVVVFFFVFEPAEALTTCQVPPKLVIFSPCASPRWPGVVSGMKL